MTFLRSLAIHTLTLIFWVLFWLPLVLPMAFLPLFPRIVRCHIVRVLLLWFGLFMVKIVWRPFFRVRYRDDSQGIREPGIVVANHRAANDAFLVSLPHLSMAQTVNGWPFRIPVIGWVARWAGYLDITNWSGAVLKERAGEVLAAGDMIVSYPEGTRSESREMNVFHSGIFQLAQELKLPLYMLCIAGNEYMPDRKFRYREFRTVSVRLLKPLSKEEVCGFASAYTLKRAVFERMSKELAEMDAELDRERNDRN